MQPDTRMMFDRVFTLARTQFKDGNLASAYESCEAAHVIGQLYIVPHTRTHLLFLKIGWRRRDIREIVGQIIRIPLGVLGSAVGIVPTGNTGGANIGMFKRIPENIETEN